jgi:hypothetical protein
VHKEVQDQQVLKVHKVLLDFKVPKVVEVLKVLRELEVPQEV